MENYKQTMDCITAPDTLRERIAALPVQNTHAPKGRAASARRIAALAAVFAVVLAAGLFSVPVLFGAAQKSAPDFAYEENSKSSSESVVGDGFAYTAGDLEAPAMVHPTADSSADIAALPQGRKLIRDATLEMETKTFDHFLVTVRQKAAALQGYTENASVEENVDGSRHATLVLRVPAEKLDSFLDGMESVGTVTSREESLRDVTQEYIDVDSRIRALETEQQSLLELLQKADKLEDILEIQDRLSEVRGSLESLKGQMQALQNQIDYSSVTISAQEVKRFTPVEKQGFGAQLRTNLAENLYGIGQGARAAALWLLSSLPYIVLIAAAAGLILLIVALIRRRRRRMR